MALRSVYTGGAESSGSANSPFPDLTMRMTLRSLAHLLPLLTAPLATPFAWGQSDAPTVRMHDLRALELLAYPMDYGVDLRLPLQSSHLDTLESDYGQSPQVPLEEASEASMDTWIGLLVDVLESEGVDELFEVEPRAGFLRIGASGPIHARVEEILTDLEAQLLRTAQLEAHLLPLGVGQDLGPLLGPAETAALLAAHPPVATARTNAVLGRRTRMGTLRWQAELTDYDVEVAETSSVSDPQVTRLVDGLELGAIVVPQDADRVLVRVWGRSTLPAAAVEHVSIDDQRNLGVRLPRQASTIVTSASILRAGGSMLVGHDRHAEGLLLVRVAGIDAAPSDAPFVNVGALLAPPLIAKLPQVWGPQPSGGMYLEPPLDEVMEQLTARLFGSGWELVDYLRTALDEAGLEALVRVIGPVAFVPDAGARTLVEKTVREWKSIGDRIVTLDLRFGTVDAETARAAQAGNWEPQGLLEDLPVRATGSCRPGDAVMLVGGEERYYLQDFDVEIASHTSIGDPTVMDSFDGFTFWCCPAVGRGGRVVAWTDLVIVQALESVGRGNVAWESGERQDGRDPLVHRASFELPSSARATHRSTASLPDGEWTLITVAELRGTDRCLVALLKASVDQ